MPTPMKRASLSATPKWLPSTSKATSSIPSGLTPSSPVPAKPQVEAVISWSLLIGGGLMRKIWHSRVQAPIYEEAYYNGETYEKRDPCRGIIPNGLRITALCPLRSVQLLGCHHCEFPPS